MQHQRGDTARGVENRGQGKQGRFAITLTDWQILLAADGINGSEIKTLLT